MIKKYEIMYIVDQDVNESDLKDITKKMDAILTAAGGKVVAHKAWGLKPFAYEINHKKKGYYFVEIVETLPENIAEFERVSKIDPAIVRTLVINTEKDNEYIASTELSKTDMTKFEEEHRERRSFKRGERNFEPRTTESKVDDKKTDDKSQKIEKSKLVKTNKEDKETK